MSQKTWCCSTTTLATNGEHTLTLLRPAFETTRDNQGRWNNSDPSNSPTWRRRSHSAWSKKKRKKNPLQSAAFGRNKTPGNSASAFFCALFGMEFLWIHVTHDPELKGKKSNSWHCNCCREFFRSRFEFIYTRQLCKGINWVNFAPLPGWITWPPGSQPKTDWSLHRGTNVTKNATNFSRKKPDKNCPTKKNTCFGNQQFFELKTQKIPHHHMGFHTGIAHKKKTEKRQNPCQVGHGQASARKVGGNLEKPFQAGDQRSWTMNSWRGGHYMTPCRKLVWSRLFDSPNMVPGFFMTPCEIFPQKNQVFPSPGVALQNPDPHHEPPKWKIKVLATFWNQVIYHKNPLKM